MRPRSLTAVVAASTAALIASTALAAGPPPKIVLQPGDFRPAAKAKILVSGREGRSGFATYAYRTSKGPHELSISVIVATSVGMAKAFYREAKNDALSFPGQQRIQLKPYGEEQFADYGGAGSQLIVRTNRVVWVLVLQTLLNRDGQRNDLTKAEAAAEYRIYAPKQQKRVGDGK